MAGIKEVVKPYGWSYSTTYRGTTAVGDAAGKQPALSTKPIPLELLKRRDPSLRATLESEFKHDSFQCQDLDKLALYLGSITASCYCLLLLRVRW